MGWVSYLEDLKERAEKITHYLQEETGIELDKKKFIEDFFKEFRKDFTELKNLTENNGGMSYPELMEFCELVEDEKAEISKMNEELNSEIEEIKQKNKLLNQEINEFKNRLSQFDRESESREEFEENIKLKYFDFYERRQQFAERENASIMLEIYSGLEILNNRNFGEEERQRLFYIFNGLLA